MAAIGFVGAGNMARALGGGLRGGVGPDRVSLVATDPVAAALEAFRRDTGGTTVGSVEELLAACDLVVLAVKPHVLPALLPRIAAGLGPRHLVVSIVAGITLDRLAAGLGAAARIVRAMPNTPALVRQGVTVLVGGAHVTPADLDRASDVFRGAGRVLVVDDEGLMDAVTAVSGSGPGFFFAYAEAMLRAAEDVGLTPGMALELVQDTLFGSAVLWRESSESVGRLREMVTSPGGTTQAGLEALERHGFAAAARAAVEAARNRSRELSSTST